MIVQHMKSDPNALSHAYWGRLVFGLALAACVITGQPWWVTLVAALVAPFIAGVGIELIQRMQRCRDKVTGEWLGFFGEHQNSLLESLLDVMQTGLFYITFWVNRRV